MGFLAQLQNEAAVDNGGMTASETARLRTLEDENRRLKKLLAEQLLDADLHNVRFWHRIIFAAASLLPIHLPCPFGVDQALAGY